MKKSTIKLAKANEYGVRHVGGKAIPLSMLMKQRIVVPDGFVIPSSVFGDLKRASAVNKKIELLLKTLRERKMDGVDDVSKEIKNIIGSLTIPKDVELAILTEFDDMEAQFVAVRSSSASEDQEEYSWAGEFATFTSVTRKDLITFIVGCWSSLYTPRALMYAYKNGISFAEEMAVIVQRMIMSDVAGVCFTVDPNSRDDDLLLIEAVRGLGESLVHGDVIPDQYWVHKYKEFILDVEIGIQKKGSFRKYESAFKD